MKLKTFLEIPSWDWPEDVDRKILKVLRDNSVDESERLLAAELAGDSTVINDDLAGELLAIVYEDIAEAASEAIEMTEMLSDLKDVDISDEFLH